MNVVLVLGHHFLSDHASVGMRVGTVRRVEEGNKREAMVSVFAVPSRIGDYFICDYET